MKIRLGLEMHARACSLCAKYGVDRGELVRMALRKYRNTKTPELVATIQQIKPATTTGGRVITIETMPEYLVDELGRGELQRVLDWYMAQYEGKPAPKAFAPDKVEGVDYTVTTKE